MGHVISKEGVATDQKKIKVIMEWPMPRNMTNVRPFMGLAGYYRRFIKWFSKIAQLITSLQRKNVKFNWYESCEEIFEPLKEFLTSAPVLKITDLEKDFVVCTNACIEGLGVVLMQEKNVICYQLHKLNEHEKNYVMHDLELATIAHALEMWRHYLLGIKFELRSDHMSLNYLFEKPTLNARKS